MDVSFEELAERLRGGSGALALERLPRPAVVHEAAARLVRLMFPTGPEGVGGEPLAVLREVRAEMVPQVQRALAFAGRQDGDATAVVDAWLERLPQVRRMLELDAQAAYEGDPAATSPEEVV
ncbi:MAG TPA: serine acetyltransferase, partial [Oceanithermus profundus]|nr:serine acetyltransferase [Oceanithermus profundus]